MDFQLLQTLPELDTLSAEWNILLDGSSTHVPFLRHEYLRAWWQTLGGGEWKQGELAVITARQNGRLAGAAPLFFTRNRDGDPALMLIGSIEISDYLDLIARPDELPAFIEGLLGFLEPPGPFAWCALDWHNLPAASPTLALLQAEAEKRGWQFALEQTYHAPAIPLLGDFEAYLSNIDKKQRHEVRRKMRRAQESGQVRWYIVDDSAALAAEVDAFLALMADDPAKVGFLSEAMRRQMHLACRSAFDNGWLQLAFMTVDGMKAGGYLNFDYNNRIWVYNSGIDRRFMEFSPGWVLLGYLLEWANEHKRAEFDFMRGNEDYKYRFGAVDRFVVRAKVTR